MTSLAEITALCDLSARIGRDPLLTQASSGNTSLKLGGTLWIKASGKWLAHAVEDDILVPVDLAEIRYNVAHDHEGGLSPAGGYALRASIETSMHAVLPHRVVIHAHSINTVAWAVRQDARERLGERLAGLGWCWIPYVPSGLPLARAIEQAMLASPGANVFVLANHGLVVCGERCDQAEELLWNVERRLGITPRSTAACLPQEGLPDSVEWHPLGGDAVSRKILRHGILYPCQAIFLGSEVPVWSGCTSSPGDVSNCMIWIVGETGAIVRKAMTGTQRAVLNGLLEVIRRLDAQAPIRYLSEAEIQNLMAHDAHAYQQCAEKNAVRRSLEFASSHENAS